MHCGGSSDTVNAFYQQSQHSKIFSSYNYKLVQYFIQEGIMGPFAEQVTMASVSHFCNIQLKKSH